MLFLRAVKILLKLLIDIDMNKKQDLENTEEIEEAEVPLKSATGEDRQTAFGTFRDQPLVD